MKYIWSKSLSVATVVALLFVFASTTSVMGSPARIEEPSFETVAYWIYSETDSDYAGAQSSDWAPPPQGSFSYKISCLDAGIGPNKYARIAQSANFDLLDTLIFDTRLYANVTNFEAQVWVGTTKVWSKAIPMTITEYLQEKVDVSGYTGNLDLIFQIENIGGQVNNATMDSYFDNIKIWGSCSDATWQIVANNFSGSNNHVYMYGENFDSGTTKVGYYDGANNLKETDTYTSWDGGTLDWSECLFTDYAQDTAAEGTWHAVVFLQADDLPDTYAGAIADSDYIIDDNFYVESTAIPEFPTVITAIVVAGLCFGIYYWMRKKRLTYVKA